MSKAQATFESMLSKSYIKKTFEQQRKNTSSLFNFITLISEKRTFPHYNKTKVITNVLQSIGPFS